MFKHNLSDDLRKGKGLQDTTFHDVTLKAVICFVSHGELAIFIKKLDSSIMATLRENPAKAVKLLVGPTYKIPRSTQRS